MEGLDERFADVRGVRLRYFTRDGHGLPLVLVHGLGGAACNWSPLVAALPRGRPLLVPDLPGHGGSSPLPSAPSLEPFAERLLLLAGREHMHGVVLVGHSLGGLVGLRAARRAPDAVRGLVLAGAAGISSTGSRARKALAVTSLVKPGRRLAPYRWTIARRPRLRRLVLAWGAADPEAMTPWACERFLAGPGVHADTVSAARAVVADDVREHLGGVSCPSLVLWGSRDTQVAVADAVDFARRLRAPLRVIADCGHLLIGERPEVCAGAIEELAASLER